MEWTRKNTALVICGAGVGAFVNLWVALTMPLAGLFLPVMGGIVGMWLLAGVEACACDKR